jgi:hypothetical protein
MPHVVFFPHIHVFEHLFFSLYIHIYLVLQIKITSEFLLWQPEYLKMRKYSYLPKLLHSNQTPHVLLTPLQVIFHFTDFRLLKQRLETYWCFLVQIKM